MEHSGGVLLHGPSHLVCTCACMLHTMSHTSCFAGTRHQVRSWSCCNSYDREQIRGHHDDLLSPRLPPRDRQMNMIVWQTHF